MFIALTIAAVIGYTAQVTGLCMVRGVNDWIRGRRLRLTAILLAGFWIYLFTPLIEYHDHAFLMVYGFHWTIPLGGFVFGIGAAVNGACSISTATRLSSGDLRMMLTVLGWLAGRLGSADPAGRGARLQPHTASAGTVALVCRRQPVSV